MVIAVFLAPKIQRVILIEGLGCHIKRGRSADEHVIVGKHLAHLVIECAALYAMTMLIINAIEVSFACNVDYTIDEKTTDIKVIVRSALPEYEEDEKKRYAVSGLIAAYYYQLNDMLEEYYDFLEVEEREEPI